MSQCPTSNEQKAMPTVPALESLYANAASLAADFFLMVAFCFRTCCDYTLQMRIDIKAKMRKFELDRQQELESHGSDTNTLPQQLPPQPPPHEQHQASANQPRALIEFLKNPDAAEQYRGEDPTSAESLQHGDIVHIMNDADQTHYPEQLFSPVQQQAIVFILQCEDRSSAMLCIPFRRRRDRRRPNPHKRYWQVVQVPATGVGNQQSNNASNVRVHHDEMENAVQGRYPHPTHADTQARPHPSQTQGTPEQSARLPHAPSNGSSQLLVCLDEGLELQTGVTMDLADIRRVEYRGLTFGMIGWMDEGSAKILVQEVKAIVKAWLENLSPEEEDVAAGPGVGETVPPPPAPPAGRRTRAPVGRRGAGQSRRGLF